MKGKQTAKLACLEATDYTRRVSAAFNLPRPTQSDGFVDRTRRDESDRDENKYDLLLTNTGHKP